MVNMNIRRALKDGSISVEDLALHLSLSPELIRQWIKEPTYKARSEMIYQAIREIQFHRDHVRRKKH